MVPRRDYLDGILAGSLKYRGWSVASSQLIDINVTTMKTSIYRIILNGSSR
ncbi:hypothetical protein ABIC12_002861 [Pantoea agglomerans]|nr:hypothetical protein [Pantoea agglomerans]